MTKFFLMLMLIAVGIVAIGIGIDNSAVIWCGVGFGLGTILGRILWYIVDRFIDDKSYRFHLDDPQSLWTPELQEHFYTYKETTVKTSGPIEAKLTKAGEDVITNTTHNKTTTNTA